MSTISTTGLPFDMDQYTREEMQEGSWSTEPLEFPAKDFEPYGYFHSIRSIMSKAARIIGTAIPSERSMPIDPEWIMVMRHCKEEQEEVADFFEPVTFNWDEDVFQVREAVRRYSEQIYADY